MSDAPKISLHKLQSPNTPASLSKKARGMFHIAVTMVAKNAPKYIDGRKKINLIIFIIYSKLTGLQFFISKNITVGSVKPSLLTSRIEKQLVRRREP